MNTVQFVDILRVAHTLFAGLHLVLFVRVYYKKFSPYVTFYFKNPEHLATTDTNLCQTEPLLFN